MKAFSTDIGLFKGSTRTAKLFVFHYVFKAAEEWRVQVSRAVCGAAGSLHPLTKGAWNRDGVERLMK